MQDLPSFHFQDDVEQSPSEIKGICTQALVLTLVLTLVHAHSHAIDTYRQYQRLKAGEKKAVISRNTETNCNGGSRAHTTVSILDIYLIGSVIKHHLRVKLQV